MHIKISKSELEEIRDKINRKLRGDRGYSKKTKRKFLSALNQLDEIINKDEREVMLSIKKGKYESVKKLSLKKPIIRSRSLFHSSPQRSFSLSSSF
ncbi:MAG: hypothetical protein PF549_03345 [Patescibacteria group bacterium]|nr:hypothetical protein [Patescibacteria group bacterium]